MAALQLYLNRAGKDATAPKEVRLSVAADAKYDTVVAVLEICKAAGLKPPVLSKLKSEKTGDLRQIPVYDLVEKIDRLVRPPANVPPTPKVPQR
jgi:hypothetical protein